MAWWGRARAAFYVGENRPGFDGDSDGWTPGVAVDPPATLSYAAGCPGRDEAPVGAPGWAIRSTWVSAEGARLRMPGVLSAPAEVLAHRVKVVLLPAALLVSSPAVGDVRVAEGDPRLLGLRLEEHLDLGVRIGTRELSGPP